MSQPPKFFLGVNIYCECKGCLRKLKDTIPLFQRDIADNHGLPYSSFYLQTGRAIVEVIGDVDKSKQEELQELLHKFTKKGSSEVCCGCFWKRKKKKCTTCNDQLKNMSINNNNDNNKSEKDDGKASQQQQHPDANSKRKGKNKSENVNQIGQVCPRNLTMSESSQNDQMGQPPRGQTRAEYYPMDHTGINPMRQMGQMNGGYYQQPAQERGY